MKKGRFLIIAIVLLAIGSVATAYAIFSSTDGTHVHSDCDHVILIDTHELLSEYLEQEEAPFAKIIVGGGRENCGRCGGSGFVPCEGRWPYPKPCQMPNNCPSCGNTGRMYCPSCRNMD